jgi:hypothetical protein
VSSGDRPPAAGLVRDLIQGIGGAGRDGDGGVHAADVAHLSALDNLAVAKGKIPGVVGAELEFKCCMSSGWLHHQLETNSKDCRGRIGIQILYVEWVASPPTRNQ